MNVGRNSSGERSVASSFVLGAFLFVGLVGLGFLLARGVLNLKALERTVTVKGLSEREVAADIAVWPIRFNEAANDLNRLAAAVEEKNELVLSFLRDRGFRSEEITLSAPSIMDRLAQGWSGDQGLRYAGASTITVYTGDVDRVRSAMSDLVELGKAGVAISTQDYEARTEFIFSGLNDLKPEMIEEATRNSREVAEKFASDSQSRLGKIRQASQGQFSIQDRDSNTPHIKKIRVVSTIEYYLSD